MGTGQSGPVELAARGVTRQHTLDAERFHLVAPATLDRAETGDRAASDRGGTLGAGSASVQRRWLAAHRALLRALRPLLLRNDQHRRDRRGLGSLLGLGFPCLGGHLPSRLLHRRIQKGQTGPACHHRHVIPIALRLVMHTSVILVILVQLLLLALRCVESVLEPRCFLHGAEVQSSPRCLLCAAPKFHFLGMLRPQQLPVAQNISRARGVCPVVQRHHNVRQLLGQVCQIHQDAVLPQQRAHTSRTTAPG